MEEQIRIQMEYQIRIPSNIFKCLIDFGGRTPELWSQQKYMEVSLYGQSCPKDPHCMDRFLVQGNPWPQNRDIRPLDSSCLDFFYYTLCCQGLLHFLILSAELFWLTRWQWQMDFLQTRQMFVGIWVVISALGSIPQETIPLLFKGRRLRLGWFISMKISSTIQEAPRVGVPPSYSSPWLCLLPVFASPSHPILALLLEPSPPFFPLLILSSHPFKSPVTRAQHKGSWKWCKKH